MAIPTYTEQQRKKLLLKARAAGFRSLSEVSRFLEAYGIKNDGNVGPETKGALEAARKKHGNKSISELTSLGIQEKKSSLSTNTQFSNNSTTRHRNPVAESYRQTAVSDNTRNPQSLEINRTKGELIREKQKEEKTKSTRAVRAVVAKAKPRSQQAPESTSMETNYPELFGTPVARDWNSFILPLEPEARLASDDNRYIQMIRSFPGSENLSDEEILAGRQLAEEEKRRRLDINTINKYYSDKNSFSFLNVLKLGALPEIIRYFMRNNVISNVLDNAYPYSYTLGGGLTSDEDYLQVILKLTQSMFGGIHPLREAFNEFVDLDLNNPEQRKRALELATLFTNLDTSDLDRVLKGMRARVDLMNLHVGKPMKYNMFTINHEYNSPSANGRPTLVYSDPEMRARENSEIANFVEQNSPTEKKDNYNTYTVVNDPYTSKGTFSIVEYPNLGIVRHVDEWGYAAPSWLKWAMPVEPIVADETTLSAPRTTSGTRISKSKGDTQFSNFNIGTFIDMLKPKDE